MWYLRVTLPVACPAASITRISTVGCFFSSGESTMMQPRQAGHLVHFLVHRHALDDVLEADLPRLFGENREGVRIPLDQHLALIDLLVRRLTFRRAP